MNQSTNLPKRAKVLRPPDKKKGFCISFRMVHAPSNPRSMVGRIRERIRGASGSRRNLRWREGRKQRELRRIVDKLGKRSFQKWFKKFIYLP